MARKLTGQERDDAEALRDAMVQVLGPADRGYAPGISSALVRVKGGRISSDDLDRILGKYDVSDAALKRMVKARLLVPADGNDGAYDLCIPATDDADEAAQDDDAAGQGDADPEATDADPEADEPASTDDADDSQVDDDAADAFDSDADDADVQAEAPEAVSDSDADATGSDADADAGEKNAPAAPEADLADGDATSQQEPAASGKPSRDAARRKEKPRRELKSVPYVRRGSEADAETRQKIVQLDQRFWMNG
ncbi:MAG: hypothetical protein LKF00_00545 [Olsenella sp.]|jgi:hypothetical protein|nr:hypothetical protein [Olsenella sp.]MCI1288274.1 hypothetical protein [Olsenella sp.]